MLKLQNYDGVKYQLKSGDIIILDYKNNLLSFSSVNDKKFHKLYFSQLDDDKYLYPFSFRERSHLFADFIAFMLGFSGVSLERETEGKKYFSIL